MKAITNEIKAILDRRLPDEAVSQHPSKAYLSSIKSIYVTERLNEAFGVGAWQISTEFIDKHEGMVVVKTTLDIPEYGIHFESYGGNDNKDLGDAYKGASTDAITKIGSWLGIGADVFKGLQNGKKGNTAPKPAPAPAPKPKAKLVINDAMIDNKDRLNKMLKVLEAAYAKDPQGFAVIRHLRDELGAEFEDNADKRVLEIWMQHIVENHL